jgi:Tfp pilus assembly protein PilF
VRIRPGCIRAAIEVLKEALAMNPTDTTALHNLGIAYTTEGEFEKASRCFEQVLYQDPAAVMPRLFLAEAYLKMKKEELARQTLELFADLLPPQQLMEVPGELTGSDPLEAVPDPQVVLPMLREIFPKIVGRSDRS